MNKNTIVIQYFASKNVMKLLLLCLMAFLNGVFMTDLLLCGYAQQARCKLMRANFDDAVFLYSPFYEDNVRSTRSKDENNLRKKVLDSDERIQNISYISARLQGEMDDKRTVHIIGIGEECLRRLGLLQANEKPTNAVWLDSRLLDSFEPKESFTIHWRDDDTSFLGVVEGFLNQSNAVLFPNTYDLSAPGIADLITEFSQPEEYVALTSYEALAASGVDVDENDWRIATIELSKALGDLDFEALRKEFVQKGIGNIFSARELWENQLAKDWAERSLFLNVSVLFITIFFLSSIGFALAALEKHAADLAVFRLLGFSGKAIYIRWTSLYALALVLFAWLGERLAPVVGSNFFFFAYRNQFIWADVIPVLAVCIQFFIATGIAWALKDKAGVTATLRRESI